jgi:hypothetical protein
LSHKKNREINYLVDIWRIFNPSEKRYSWRQNSPTIHCRLDFFKLYLLYYKKNIHSISYGFKSDHSFLSLEIDKQQLNRQTTIKKR